MIADLKPYPAYKDSGVPWLEEVPEYWEVPRLGAVLRERGETNADGRVTDVLSVVRDRGVIPYAEKGNVGNKKSDDITRYKVVRPNDIVVNCMNVIIGSVGLSKYTGCLSPVYYVLTRRSEGDDPRYLNAYFQTKPFQLSLVRIGNGILAHRMRIPMELLKCEMFPRPPLPEQAAIVRFLDHADQRIRRYISAKQKLIKLLEEQKQAIIHRAVTRGLDPNVRLKPSGVEWLGEVPEHWEVKPLKQWAKINAQTLPETTEPHCEFQYIDIGAVGTGILVEQPERIRFGDAPSRARRILKQGDTIISTVRTYLKAVYFISDNSNDLIASTGFAVLTPRLGILPEYLSFVIQSNTFIDRVTAHSIGIAYPAIAETRLGAFHVALSSIASEQRGIVNYIRTQTRGLDDAISRAHREISLLREYRTRLIADVVTGKLDAREAAASLPDEAEELEPLDDTEPLTDGEEATNNDPYAETKEAEV